MGLALQQKHRTPANEAFFDLRRGDVVAIEGTESRGDGLALTADSTARVAASAGRRRLTRCLTRCTDTSAIYRDQVTGADVAVLLGEAAVTVGFGAHVVDVDVALGMKRSEGDSIAAKTWRR